MCRLIDVDFRRRRIKTLGHRWHHGTVGVVSICFGVLAVAHDWADRRVWLGDLLHKS